MEMTGQRVVPAPPDAVWTALNDPEVLKAAVPGCESLTLEGVNEWRAVMAARVGPVSARFSGRIQIVDADPPSGYTLKFEGQGGAAGFANGEARVTLTPHDGGTTLDYAVKAQVGGKLAQIGSRLVDGAAAKIADEFFARFVAHFTPATSALDATAGQDEAVGTSPETGAAARAPQASRPAARDAGGMARRMVRYGAIALILIVIGILYARGYRF